MAVCNTDELFEDACESGFKPGISEDLYRAIVLQLLCNIAAGGGTGGGTNHLLQGNGPPSSDPADTSENWQYWDRDSGITYNWNTDALAWQ